MSKKDTQKSRKTRKSKGVKEEPEKEAWTKAQDVPAEDNQEYGGMNMSNFRKNLGCG